MPVNETSTNATVPAVNGSNTAGGDGLVGQGRRGVVGSSDVYQGVYGVSRDNAAIVGESANFHAVFGITHSPLAGVFGASDTDGDGVAGSAKSGRGVNGVSETGDGVHGTGVRGVVGESQTYQGVYGNSRANAGVVGESAKFHAVFAITHSSFAGVFGSSDAGGTGVAGDSPTGIGVHGKGGRLAGLFEGNVEITGDLTLTNADCAEDFDVANPESVEPGTVMVLNEDGRLRANTHAYDKRVVVVISGAGSYKPGIVLDKRPQGEPRLPVALVGKVFCKVDASLAAIEVGDLLTTSSTSGCAMKATDPALAFGSIIGKALRAHAGGVGLIPILVALQ